MFPVLCLSLYPYSSETNFSKISHNLTPSCVWGHFNVLYLADKVFVLFLKKGAVLGEIILNSDFKISTDLSSLSHQGLAPLSDQAAFGPAQQSPCGAAAQPTRTGLQDLDPDFASFGNSPHLAKPWTSHLYSMNNSSRLHLFKIIYLVYTHVMNIYMLWLQQTDLLISVSE